MLNNYPQSGRTQSSRLLNRLMGSHSGSSRSPSSSEAADIKAYISDVSTWYCAALTITLLVLCE